jgi:hypothetical protein
MEESVKPSHPMCKGQTDIEGIYTSTTTAFICSDRNKDKTL